MPTTAQRSELRISVVIYLKNAVETIAHCLESVLNQDYEALELIVIDGASTDGSVDVLKHFENHLDHFISEPDHGATDAANKGISLTTGEIVVLLMADDWLEPDALSAINEAFLADPNCGLISSGVRVVELTTDGVRVISERLGHDNSLTIDNILDVPYSAARYYRRKALLDSGGFDDQFPICHDRELFFKLMAQHTASGVIDRVLYVYRYHPGSRTMVFSPDTYRRIYREHDRLAKRYAKDPRFDAAAQRKIKEWGYEQHARNALLELRTGNILRGCSIVVGERLYSGTAVVALFRRMMAIVRRRRAGLR